jgi:hypothetical protein
MGDPYARIERIEAFCMDRLYKILDFYHEPRSIKEMSGYLFRSVSIYKRLLALQETGAYMEYLYQRGYLAIDNFEDSERQADPVLYYRTL